jgi:DNA adenine methylase
MILRRLGNKAKLADKIISLFPEHKYYIELFFGTGAIFWRKKPCKWNLINDIDNDVYNLWDVYYNRFDELKEMIETTPESQYLFNHWVKNQETDPIKKAVRFLWLSNFSYMGKSDTMKLSISANDKLTLLKKLIPTCSTCTITNSDAVQTMKNICFFENYIRYDKCLIYADPPYLSSTNNYSTTWKEQDTLDLFQILDEKAKKYGIKYAISEFNNPKILELAEQYGLQVHYIAERQTLKSRNTEILLTNYKLQDKLF